MNAIDIILAVLLAVVLFFALRSVYKAKKAGKCCSCGGDCSCCSHRKH